MNYYPFHVGDYAAHTAHLEPMEDLAYRRMLDLYYRTERALPADPQEIARLTRLKDQREAIDVVLKEFFILSRDGWHSKRADDELTSMLEKQEQQATKDAHEADRMRRYRERRAEMFAALRAAGVVPAWDVAMKELQRLHDEHCNAPATRTGALPEMDSQRLSLPTPTPTPTPKKEKKEKPPAAPLVLVSDLVAAGFDEITAAEFIAHKSKLKAPLTARAWADHLREASKAGWTPLAAAEKVMAKSWKGFEAKYVAGEPRAGPSPMTFKERDAANAAERVHEMTGGLVSARPITRRNDALQEVFDAAPRLTA